MRRTGIAAYASAIAVSVGSLAAFNAIPQLPHDAMIIPIILIAYRTRLGPALLATVIMIAGRALWLDGIVGALTDGLIAAVVVGVVDALHRSRAREQRARVAEKTSQRRFQQLFYASPVALSLSKLDDQCVVEVNDAYLRIFGLRRDQIIGRTPPAAGISFPSGLRERAFAALRENKTVHLEAEVNALAGPRAVMLWSRAIELDGKQHAMSTFLDITEQRAAQEALRTNERRLRELAENVQEVFWLTDVDNSKMLYISPSYERVFGRTCAELYANSHAWLLAIHPDDRARLQAAAAPERQATSWQEQYRVVRPDGAIRTVRITVSPIRDESGRVVRVAGVAEDITEHLVLEGQMRQTQKLESLGLLAGGVAHDFNNILAVIAANAGLLGECLPHDDENADLVQEIDAAVRRATSLTRQLLAFSRKQVVEPIVLDLNAAIGDARKMLRRMLGEDISISTSLEPELGRVLMDPGYLVQVLMNLAVNARDAMPRGGSLTISTRNVGREVMLSISDTGCGMSPEVMGRIFEPFFTTKEVGHGTGLGLSVVHGIIEQAGGRLDVESQVGVGTTMKIFLPVTDAPAECLSDVVIADATGTENILVVDDDMFVRVATSRTLRARGYTVIEAHDGHAALRLLRDRADIDLLVTDVVMPGLDGRELVEAARQHRPALKVLYISGYTDDAVLRHGIRHAEVSIIEKPFRGHSLAGKVRQILDAA